MKQNGYLRGLWIAVALATAQSYGNGVPHFDYGDLPGRVYTNYEGHYTFSDAAVLSIEGYGDIHVLKYKCSAHEGVVVVFARITSDGTVQVLRECGPNSKGVTPYLEGIDVIPEGDRAELIVRWRHPGQGGLRTVEKFLCTSDKLDLLNSSEYTDKKIGERGMRWINSADLTREAGLLTNRPQRTESPLIVPPVAPSP